MLTRKEIEALIPHRAPMLLVDEVLDIQPETSLHARKTFGADDLFFKGHFPGHPILPGIVMVESLAQSAAVLVNHSRGKRAEESLFAFMSVDDCKFRRPITPGAVVDLRVTQAHRRGDVYRFHGVAEVEGKPAATATFTAKWMPAHA